MESNFDAYNDDEQIALLNRFEKMLKENQHFFFDVEEFEAIIDYYLENLATEKAKKVIDFSLAQHPTSSSLKIKQAQFFVASHKPNKALEILNTIEAFEPFNGDIFLTKAHVHSQLRQHLKAIENYYKALKLIDDLSEKTNIKIQIAFEYEN